MSDWNEKKEIYKPNPKSQDGVADLCQLTYLGEQNVLHNLEFRYAKDEIYTSTTAKVLIALNPYQSMPDIYSTQTMAKYQASPINLEGLTSTDDLPPHLFNVAHSAYSRVVYKKQNQSVIVCGESGSGKTESNKYLMKYLAFTTTSTSLDPSEFAEAEKIGQQVLDANPILETFGNAKTVLNNNSSRFGKFTKMLFEDAPPKDGIQRRKLIGAMIETYLLEKSRVHRQDPGERNYHVFYQLCYSADSLPHLKLDHPDKFHYLNQSGCTTINDGDVGKDIGGFQELLTGMNTLEFPKKLQDEIISVTAGILHAGNVVFQNKAKGEGSDITNLEEVKISAQLLGVDEAGLAARLQTKNFQIENKTIVKPLDAENASMNRDAVCKALYNGLFRWLVARINQCCNAKTTPGIVWIGSLDVFGFEIFEHNSFEQFCINFANERLQQYFNEHILKAEQDLYRKEALLWDPIELPDNQDTIDLVTKKPYGILALLDSACIQPKGSFLTFQSTLFQHNKYHPKIRKPEPKKASKDTIVKEEFCGFLLRHYAGRVEYDVKEFLVKNADSTAPETEELLDKSKIPLATEILRISATGEIVKKEEKKKGGSSFKSTGSVFSAQLAELMDTLSKTQPYFVRCIKPNAKKKPNHLIAEYVRPQLRCGGIVEALRIIKLGFPTRLAFTQIHKQFGSILDPYKTPSKDNLNKRDFAQAIMLLLGEEKLDSSQYQLGLSMVFFRPGYQQYLDKILGINPKDVPTPKVQEIRKFLVRKRILRGKGTIRAYIRCMNGLQYARMKKILTFYLLTYRTFGRNLKQARENILIRQQQAEAAAKLKDQQFQDALKAKDQLAQIKAEQEKFALKMEKEKENMAKIADEKKKAQDQAKTFMEQLQTLRKQMADMEKVHSKEVSDIKGKADQERRQIADLQDTESRNKSRLADLEQQLAREKESSRLLKDSQTKLEGERNLQLSQLSEAKKVEIQVESLRSQLEDYKKQLERYKKDLDTARENHEKLRESHDTETRAKRDAESTIADLKRKQQQLEGENSSQLKLIAQGREAQLNLDTASAQLAALRETHERSTRERKEENAAADELRKKVMNLENELSSTNDKLRDANTQLENTKTNLNNLRDNNNDISKAKKDLEREFQNTIDEHKRRQQQLEGEISSQLILISQGRQAQIQLERSNADLADLRERLERVGKDAGATESQLQSQVDQLKRRSRELENDLMIKDSTIEENRLKLIQEQKIREQIEDKMTQLEKDALAKNTRLDTLSQELLATKTKSAADHDAHTKKIEELRANGDEAKKDLALANDRLQNERQTMQSRQEELRREIDRERQQARERQDHLQQQLRDKDSEVQLQVNLMKITKEQLESSRKDTSRDDSKVFEKQIQQLTDDIKWLRDSLKDANTKQDSTDRALQYKNEEIAKLYQQLDDLRTKHKEDMKEEKEDWRNREARLEKRLGDKEDQLSTVRQEHALLQGRLELISSREKSLADENSALREKAGSRSQVDMSQMESSRSELASSNKKIEALEKKYTSAHEQAQQLQKRVQELQEKLESEAADKHETVSHFKNERGLLQNQIKSLKAQLSKKSTAGPKIDAAREKELQSSLLERENEVERFKREIEEIRQDHEREKDEWEGKEEQYEISVQNLRAENEDLQEALREAIRAKSARGRNDDEEDGYPDLSSFRGNSRRNLEIEAMRSAYNELKTKYQDVVGKLSAMNSVPQHRSRQSESIQAPRQNSFSLHCTDSRCVGSARTTKRLHCKVCGSIFCAECQRGTSQQINAKFPICDKCTSLNKNFAIPPSSSSLSQYSSVLGNDDMDESPKPGGHSRNPSKFSIKYLSKNGKENNNMVANEALEQEFLEQKNLVALKQKKIDDLESEMQQTLEWINEFSFQKIQLKQQVTDLEERLSHCACGQTGGSGITHVSSSTTDSMTAPPGITTLEMPHQNEMQSGEITPVDP